MSLRSQEICDAMITEVDHQSRLPLNLTCVHVLYASL